MKKILFTIAALFCTTLSFAQEYMVIENNAGGWTSIDVSVISQAYFKEYPSSGEGTKENPFNVAAANAKCKAVGAEPSAEKYYVKGIVVSTGSNINGRAAYIADDDSGINRLYIYKLSLPEGITLTRNDEVVLYGVLYHWGNLTTEMEAELVAINGQDISGGNVETVPISNVIAGEDGITYCVRGEVTKIANTQYGNFYIKDETGELYVYGTLDANGATKNFASLGIEVGDIVTVMGPRKDYNGTVELVNVRVMKIEKPDTPTPSNYGTAEAPLTVAQAIALIDAESNISEAYVKGKISKIDSYNATYKSITYWISDDGTTTTQLQVYSGKGLNGVDFASKEDLTVGKTVVIKGTLKKYNTTYEFDKNSSIISIEGEGGGGTPSDEVKVVSIAQFNAAEVSTDVWYQLTGIVCNLKDGDLYGNFDLMDATDSVYVYGLLSEKGGAKKLFQELVAAKGIKNGSKITIIGTRGEYNGKIEVLNAYFVSIEGEGGGGTPTPSGEVQAVTVAQFNEAAESNEVWYQLTGTISNLKDGDLYGNFDLTDETGSVYVYGLLSEKGGAKKFFQELVATYGITNGSKITIIGNRGSYAGKIEVTKAYFVSIEASGTRAPQTGK